MEFCRYALLVLESEDKKSELINRLSSWRYSDELSLAVRSSGFSFALINEDENIIIYFKNSNFALE